VNVLGAPGAGKTASIVRIAEKLNANVFVIEGDAASDIDTKALNEKGIPAVQINTGGGCRLDISEIKAAFGENNFSGGFLFVENIGNLICPAAFSVGEHARLLVSSVTEGDDKPYKYPAAFEKSEIILLNKCDLLPFVDFDSEYYIKGVRHLNEKATVYTVSGKNATGYGGVARWITDRAKELTK
ncbi:MAG: hydrogenase nickel incorporation protein HypB, partial [Defluviitaleaceae bacterium]|nr:hydrogenase nickel incorporation protein HypB [Defluviitaleaceae bacterium]